MTTPTALDGIRVLDFTWVLAGPYCTRILADLGAEVIKVQSTATSQGLDATGGNTANPMNRNKKSIRLNMRKAEAKQLALRLAGQCDVVVDNFSARVMKSWGLGYEDLIAVRPDIIAMSMSGFGHGGPWNEYVSFGLTLQALSGVTNLMSHSGRAPQGFGYSYADYAGGLSAAIAVLAALRHREQTGEGQFIDVSQFEAMAALTGLSLLNQSVTGETFQAKGNLLQSRPCGPYGAYRCKDDESGKLGLVDRWVAIGVTNEEEWQALVAAMGQPTWGADSRFGTQDSRYENASALDMCVESWTREKDPFDVMRLLRDSGVPAGVVQNSADIVHADTQMEAFGFWWRSDELKTPFGRMDGFPVQMSETPARLRNLAPLMGQHDDDVLGNLLGLGKEELARLQTEEVIW